MQSNLAGDTGYETALATLDFARNHWVDNPPNYGGRGKDYSAAKAKFKAELLIEGYTTTREPEGDSEEEEEEEEDDDEEDEEEEDDDDPVGLLGNDSDSDKDDGSNNEEEMQEEEEESGEEDEEDPVICNMIRSNFQDYVVRAQEHFVAIPTKHRLAIELMSVLRRTKAPLDTYDNVMAWHLRNTGALGEHQSVGSCPDFVSKEKLFNYLKDRYNRDDKDWCQVHRITLPSSKARVNIVLNDAQAV